ncbi:hypothetical protein DEDE109153_04465 [Deinococcus deserti]|uniref:Uncharacterized protein n=1 Tax=Deinococcus deserti (strain DSM 17065 / CIP 109153 / LMG 22923 / VCD115) TaxID=546414 RepID=C1D0W9_DEIDV|nr:hypothetical protein [Deinococcus deserti]ACO45493.2 Hypothetical protein Deide_06471 [Deinococcus deserti VCD115]
MTQDELDFYDTLHRQVRSGLRAEGVKPSALGVLDVVRAVKRWTVLSQEWDDAEIYELNVKAMVKRFSRTFRKAGLLEVFPDRTPEQSQLDSKHGVAYATAENELLYTKVRAIRLTMTGSTAPLFPWLDLGYGEARRNAEEWLVQQQDPSATLECELVIRLTTSQASAWMRHVREVAERYADDQEWQNQGQPLTPELGAALFAAPNFASPMVIVESSDDDGDLVRSTGILARTVGTALNLPGRLREVEVPLSGVLFDFHQALTDIALTTTWWDTSHALEYVLTGHPPLPLLASPPATGGRRRDKVLTRQHVALLELKHRLPEASWRRRLEQFNTWCDRVDALRPFLGSTAPQAIREEHARAHARATHFSTFVKPSEGRSKLEHPESKLW